MKKKICMINEHLSITFSDEEIKKMDLKQDDILNMDDCFVEKRITEEESYEVDKKAINLNEGKYNPLRVVQHGGTM